MTDGPRELDRRWRGEEPARESSDWPRWWEQAFVDALRADFAVGPKGPPPSGGIGGQVANLERLRIEQGLHLNDMYFVGEHPETQFIMSFFQEDSSRDFGVFVNLWQVFTRDSDDPPHPRDAASSFWVWTEEPGGLVEPGIGMAWQNDAGEPVEWFWDPGSLLFRGPPFRKLLNPPKPGS